MRTAPTVAAVREHVAAYMQGCRDRDAGELAGFEVDELTAWLCVEYEVASLRVLAAELGISKSTLSRRVQTVRVARQDYGLPRLHSNLLEDSFAEAFPHPGGDTDGPPVEDDDRLSH